MITAIIPAAGSGRRMKANMNKQFMKIAGQPVLTRSLLSLRESTGEFIIVARSGEEELCLQAIPDQIKNYKIVSGGPSRQDSVYNALKHAQGDYVLIHDGSRPLASPNLVRRVIEAARCHGAAVPALPVVETIKEVSNGFVVATLPRQRLQAVQTPQVFQKDLLHRAHLHARQQGIKATDDASLVEALGYPVAVVPGETGNIKITTPEDLSRARLLLTGDPCLERVRIGIGYDVHQLVEGRKMILGGEHIPYAKGLLGHSDADVLVHAIIDALLGAAALGDIGRHFPDTDPGWAGADSCKLLAQVGGLLADRGLRVLNLDAVIVAQQPKISPYIPAMIINISRGLKISPADINIKATTTESLGFTGRGEGIAAQCVCLLAAARGGSNDDSEG